ncbi:MAG: NAD(P)/FAD-dependent oxidoreductase, partial [Ktedonobacterales bacterium]
SYAATAAQFGRDRARRLWDFNVRNQRLAAALIEELAAQDWACGFRRTGSLRIAASDAELADYRASDTLLREDGWSAELVAQDDLPAAIRAHYAGGLFIPGDGEIQPARLVAGLAHLAVEAGAALYEDTPALRITRDGEGLRIETAAGSVRARHLLLATNAWLPELAAQLGAEAFSHAITPTRGQMLVTAPLDARLFDCPCYADVGYQYWRQLGDGRLVIGGWRNTSFETEDIADETPEGPVQAHLEGFVRQTLGLRELPIERRWAGIMAFSADGLPYAGMLPGVPGVYVCGGYTGHGNACAILAARTVADLLRDRPSPDADLFDPARIGATGPSSVAQ